MSAHPARFISRRAPLDSSTPSLLFLQFIHFLDNSSSQKVAQSICNQPLPASFHIDGVCLRFSPLPAFPRTTHHPLFTTRCLYPHLHLQPFDFHQHASQFPSHLGGTPPKSETEAKPLPSLDPYLVTSLLPYLILPLTPLESHPCDGRAAKVHRITSLQKKEGGGGIVIGPRAASYESRTAAHGAPSHGSPVTACFLQLAPSSHIQWILARRPCV